MPLAPGFKASGRGTGAAHPDGRPHREGQAGHGRSVSEKVQHKCRAFRPIKALSFLRKEQKNMLFLGVF